MGIITYFVIGFIVSILSYAVLKIDNVKRWGVDNSAGGDEFFVIMSLVVGMLWPITILCLSIYVAGNWVYKIIQRRMDNKGE